jgi:signal transduction histidine kinase
VRLKNRCDALLQVNQEAMVRAQHRADEQAAGARRTAVLVALALLVFGPFYAINLSRALVAPLRRLAVAAERIGEGHLDTRIDVRTKDEVETLAAAFNSMVDRLRAYRGREAARLQVAEEKSDAVLNSLYEPVIVTGAEGEIIGFNRSAGILLTSAAASIGHPVETIGIPAVATAVREAIKERSPVAPEGERGLARIPVQGAERFYHVRTAPVVQQTGTVVGTVTVLEDVTRMRQLDRLKDEFISVASHELRTPLTSLELAIQLLSEGSGGSLSATQHRLVNIAVDDAQRLERLTRDLLDLTRLEAGVSIPAPEPVRAAEGVDMALTPLRSLAAEKGISLSADVDAGLPAVMGSKEHLSRAVTNLVDNALRHTPSGGRVDVTARVTDHTMEFSVADTGEGIPPEYLPHLFERFVQVPGASSRGAGLGLSIVRKIVEAHRGTVGVESTMGRGARFHFTIPLAGGPWAGAAPPAADTGAV